VLRLTFPMNDGGAPPSLLLLPLPPRIPNELDERHVLGHCFRFRFFSFDLFCSSFSRACYMYIAWDYDARAYIIDVSTKCNVGIHAEALLNCMLERTT